MLADSFRLDFTGFRWRYIEHSSIHFASTLGPLLTKGQLPFYAEALFQKYGTTVKIGPNNVGFIGASVWKNIYGMHFRH
ncbi:uncharacterized protein PgNI_02623 [Pyricularia grisea]|uniref:Uncharacterized protein n=1 Tax=Pyricularia grisea TaxID=148305 RepID=A0A6P8BHM5_PYRGI|nr:uncharacterized protein PgNI_02623 [Pyricularia grisea]TLD16230.1 hypothetical protein PgNI_02623 [Pyricularia grisea]